MSSSPTTAVAAHQSTRVELLLDLLAGVPDPRDPRGVRYPLVGVLAVAVSSARLGLSAAPEESTLRKLFARVDAGAWDRVIGALIWTRTARVDGRRVIAIDGKTVRGAKRADGRAPHLVAALDHRVGAVVEQMAVDAKSNEISCVREVLACFDLTGVVVTVDAMHTQTDTAQLITDGGGDYVCTVKANTPTLYRQLKDLPWQQVPGHSYTQTGHGRRVTPTIKVIDGPDWVDFPSAAQVAQVRRTLTRTGKKTVEVVYLITSADHHAAPPATLAAWVQGHWDWGIENRLHWVRDLAFDEDRSQVRTGNAPRLIATLRNTATSLLRLAGWTNIAHALRHHARHPQRTLTLLLTC